MKYLALLSLLFLLLYAGMRLVSPGPWVFDDAFMFVRYANQFLADGHIGWNPGEHTFGCTSLGYLSWITFLQSLFSFSAPLAKVPLLLSSLGFGLMALWLLGRMMAAIRPAGFPAWWWSLPLLASLPFQVNALSGMDTTLSLAANALAVLLWVKSNRKQHRLSWLLPVVVSYLSFLIRPDNAIYALTFGPLWLWSQGKYRAMWQAGAVLALLFTLDTALKTWYFGHPLPLPYFAKSSNLLEGYLGVHRWPTGSYLLSFLLLGALPMLALLLQPEPRALNWKAWLAAWLPLAPTLLILSLSVQIMGFQARLFLPSLPFLMAGPWLAVSGKTISGSWALSMAIIVWSLVGAGGVAVQEWSERRQETEEAEANAVLEQHESSPSPVPPDALNLLTDLLPEGGSLAATEHGYLSVRHPGIRILDLAGLHDPVLARQGLTEDWIRNREPDLIWMPHSDYTGLRTRLLHSPAFEQHYLWFPGLFEYGLAVRRESPAAAAQLALLASWGLFPANETSAR